ncbi:MAG: PDZ domain-containing protein, partial [Thermoanaerobaculia bacterium]|nr:PDZ domain-containing protein [Thermoanaerobaculia bacterium]
TTMETATIEAGGDTDHEATPRVWVFRVGQDGNEWGDKALERVENGQILLESESGREMTLPTGERGYLGVHVLEISDELRSHWGLAGDRGVLVSRVVADSPASRAGLEVGDVLLAVDGSPVESSWDLKRLIAPRQAKEPVRLEFARSGMVWNLEAILEGRQSRTLDLAPLIHTDQDGRVVLVAPRPREGDASSQFRWTFRSGDDTSDHLELAFEEAVEALGSYRLQKVVGEEAETRKELEERIEFLERRLREVELQLETTTKPKRGTSARPN